jgi:transposase-like protein
MTSIYGPMTPVRKSRIWELWRRGRPMSFIAADIDKPPATVFSYLLYHGGMEPRTRVRRADSLSFDEREMISRSLARGDSMRAIAKTLDRAPSSISREIARNGGVSRYRAALAEKAFLKRAKRPKPMLLVENTTLRDTVCRLLEEDWSPEQISGRLKASQAADGSNTCMYPMRPSTSPCLYRQRVFFVRNSRSI